MFGVQWAVAISMHIGSFLERVLPRSWATISLGELSSTPVVHQIRIANNWFHATCIVPSTTNFVLARVLHSPELQAGA
jgi:hypothetical protein